MVYTARHKFPITTANAETLLNQAVRSLQAEGAKLIKQTESSAELRFGSPILFRLFGMYLSSGLSNLPINIRLQVASKELIASFDISKNAAYIRDTRIEDQFGRVVGELSRLLNDI